MNKVKLLIWTFVLGASVWGCFAKQNHYFRDVSSSNTIEEKRTAPSYDLSSEQTDDNYIDSVEEVDDCTRLPPMTSRSKVQHEQMSFKNLIDGGFDNMVNVSDHEDVILIMGNTGVGKSVITQIIAGDLNRIHAVKTDTGKLVIVDDFERISAPSVISRTLVPELVVKSENESNVAFFDCPGFDDTRGPAQDVATNFFINQIISKVKRVKILFLILQSSVEMGHDRLDFDLMVQHATSFVKNVTMFKDSIALVATKVKNYDESGKFKKDKNIKNKILEFLKSYKRTLQNSLKEQTLDKINKIRRKIELVNIFLERDADRKYGKITFSRDPEKCGPLSESSEVANTKDRIEQMYSALKFGSIGDPAENFGFSLKPETILQINSDYIPELNNGVVQQVETLFSNFTTWFETERMQDQENYFLSNSDNITSLADCNGVTIGNLLNHDYNHEINQILIDSTAFSKALKCALIKIGYLVPEQFQTFMEKQNEMFDFFQKAIGSNSTARRITDWRNPLINLREKIITTYLPQINDRIVANVEKLVDGFKNWIDEIKLGQSRNSLKSTTAKVNISFDPKIGVISNILNLVLNRRQTNVPISASNFVTALQNGFIQIGYSVPEHFVHFMKSQEITFIFFEQFVGDVIEIRRVNEWLSPLSNLRNYIEGEYASELNDEVHAKIGGLVANFETWFTTAKTDGVNSDLIGSSKLEHDTRITLSDLLRQNNRFIFTLSTDTLSKVLEKGFYPVGFVVPGNFTKFMEMQSQLFEICQKIVGSEIVLRRPTQWTYPLLHLRNKISSVFIPELNNIIVDKVDRLVINFINWLDIVKLVGVRKSTSVNLNASPYVTNANFSTILSLNAGSKIGSSLVNSSIFGNLVKNQFNQVGYLVPENFANSMQKLDIFFNFFESLVGSITFVRRVADWTRPLSNLRNNVTGKYISELNDKIVSEVEQLVENFEIWFDTEKLGTGGNYSIEQADNLNKIVDKTSVALEEIVSLKRNNRFIKFTMTPVEFSDLLNMTLKKMDYSVPGSFFSLMEIQDSVFKILQNFVEPNDLNQKYTDWVNPLAGLHTKILEYKYWFGFCANLQIKLGSYEFHEKKSNFQTYNGNWLEYLEKNRIFTIDQSLKNLQTKYGRSSKQVKLLNDMMTYATSPLVITCTQNSITMKGHFVTFSEFLDRNEQFDKTRYTCLNRSLENALVEGFVAKKIFIDTGLNAVGLGLSFIVISPQWEVVDPVHLNFDGKAGMSQGKAKWSDVVFFWQIFGKMGNSGLAGMAGSPGGFFYGISQSITASRKLKISANGGNGGSGQDGGDGGVGDDAEENGESGSPGGDGGDGGVGGLGGIPGEIKLKSFSDLSASLVEVSVRFGNVGDFGKGGEAGLGGKYGRYLDCDSSYFPILEYSRTCNWIPQNRRASNGQKGKDNESKLNLRQPISGVNRIDEVESLLKYKQFFSTSLMNI